MIELLMETRLQIVAGVAIYGILLLLLSASVLVFLFAGALFRYTLRRIRLLMADPGRSRRC